MSAFFSVHKEGQIFFIEFNTPGSTVNIFNRATGLQIQEFFGSLRPDSARLIVFKSGKPYSFLNGTELLSANSVTSDETMKMLIKPMSDAYHAVEQCPIPMVSAIEGSCFGCGVEFALCTDYRVASNSFDTYFYMTELKDYYFPPVYGGMGNYHVC